MANNTLCSKRNTIIYAIPSDNDLAKDIESRKIRKCSTEYVGNSIADVPAKFGFDASSLGSNPTFGIERCYYKRLFRQVTLTKEEFELWQK